MQWPGTRSFFKQLVASWSDDSLTDTAAALSFWGLLALFPFVIFVVALAGVLVNPSDLHRLIDELAVVVPREVATILGGELDRLARGPSTGLLTFGIVIAIWAASGGVSSLIQALDRCYNIRETRPYWKTRGLSILITLGAGLLTVLTLLITFAVPLVGKWVGGPAGAVIKWARFPVAGVILLGLWAFLYWALPNVRSRFQLVTPGSVVGVLVWLAGSWGFSEYARHFGKYETTYGALGGFIVLLLWMWLSASALLLGAEINKILTPAEDLKRSPTGEKRRDKTPSPTAQPKPQPA